MRDTKQRIKKLKVIASLALILLITFVAFSPCLKNGFVNWDDNVYVTQNPLIKELSLSAVKNIFSSLHEKNYHPLALLSFALEYHFFHLDPFAYHATNLILHLLNALLVFWLIFMLSSRISVSFLTAIFFGIHPLHVESVAWISERRDVLYAFFFLGALIQYLYYRKNKVAAHYYLSLFLFLMAVLSKAMAITLPFVLLLCGYLLGDKLNRNSLKQAAPFFAITLIFGSIAFFSHYFFGYVHFQHVLQFFYGICISSHALLFYLVKTIIPLKLSAVYAYTMGTGVVLPWEFLFSPAIVSALAAFVVFSLRYTRKIVFGSLFFLITVLPTLQLVFSDISPPVADRYTYIPLIGMFYIIAEGFAWLYALRIRYVRMTQAVLSVALVSFLGILTLLTWQRCRVWKDSISLWTDVLNKHPNFTTAYNNLGNAYYAAGEYEKAIPVLKKAIEMNPRMAYAYLNLGNSYNALGRRQEALALHKKAAEIDHMLTEE